jgi:hypothetical protein
MRLGRLFAPVLAVFLLGCSVPDCGAGTTFNNTCHTVADCAADNEPCRITVCEESVCQYQATSVPQWKLHDDPYDCQTPVCKGGSVAQKLDPTDAPLDSQCRSFSCGYDAWGLPVVDAVETQDGTPCPEGVCQSGACVAAIDAGFDAADAGDGTADSGAPPDASDAD